MSKKQKKCWLNIQLGTSPFSRNFLKSNENKWYICPKSCAVVKALHWREGPIFEEDILRHVRTTLRSITLYTLFNFLRKVQHFALIFIWKEVDLKRSKYKRLFFHLLCCIFFPFLYNNIHSLFPYFLVCCHMQSHLI